MPLLDLICDCVSVFYICFTWCCCCSCRSMGWTNPITCLRTRGLME